MMEVRILDRCELCEIEKPLPENISGMVFGGF